jgi:hypothetical protein
MTTKFAQQLKTLTDLELDKLERILILLAHGIGHDFEEMLEQIGATRLLSPTDADLIGARIYELEISEHLDPADARKKALEEFNSGKLHKPKKSIPRYRGKATKPTAPTAVGGNANAAPGPQPPAAPLDAPPAALTPCATELPDNVVPLRPRFYSKFFNSPLGDNSVW